MIKTNDLIEFYFQRLDSISFTNFGKYLGEVRSIENGIHTIDNKCSTVKEILLFRDDSKRALIIYKRKKKLNIIIVGGIVNYKLTNIIKKIDNDENVKLRSDLKTNLK